MDIKGKIEEIVAKVKSDKTFAAKFTENPVEAVSAIVGANLPANQINQLVDGVKAKVSVDKAGDLLGKAKGLFNK